METDGLESHKGKIVLIFLGADTAVSAMADNDHLLVDVAARGVHLLEREWVLVGFHRNAVQVALELVTVFPHTLDKVVA